jgi:hypothetical protein
MAVGDGSADGVVDGSDEDGGLDADVPVQPATRTAARAAPAQRRLRIIGFMLRPGLLGGSRW